MKIERDNFENKTKIESFLCGYNKIECIFSQTSNNNSDAKFNLKIEEGGQVERGCDLLMYGPIERIDLLKFLKQLIIEIELLDNEYKTKQ